MRHGAIRSGLLAATLTGLCAAVPVVAQDFLTIEELKTCQAIQRDLEQRWNTLDQRNEVLRRDESRLKQSSLEVAERGRLVKPSDRRLVEQYDRLRAEQARLYEIYAEAVRSYNTEIASYNDDLAEYKRRCGVKRYDEARMRHAKEEIGLK